MAKPRRYVPDPDMTPARADLFAQWDLAAGLNPELQDTVRSIQAELKRLIAFERAPIPE